MSEPITTFNETRRQRATSERRFQLGAYTFVRRVSVAPEMIIEFQQRVTDAKGDDAIALHALEGVVFALCEDEATRTQTGEAVPLADAWRDMRTVGDEYGPLDIEDINAVVEWLISGVAERPTGQPSGSQDGSATPAAGTNSTDVSPLPAQVLTL